MYARIYGTLIFCSSVVGSNFAVYYGLENGNRNVFVTGYVGAIWGMVAGVACPLVPFVVPGMLMNRSFREELLEKVEKLA